MRAPMLHLPGNNVMQATVHITAASVWLRIARRYMWGLRTEGGRGISSCTKCHCRYTGDIIPVITATSYSEIIIFWSPRK
ncbi:uncharacterized protein F4812DRAFT_420231 [Daldinia caldariorum]|uniref:uncharacterized protein n=1 Tax=Daldinia caldariorum TaxID=326644 RepID=UPI002007C161|nr:uncharacterized protein F4812DRAFT_420231 [Daldinia caldariorum]KAI1469754.1 hypothetical protein F4812DRAFT_420231 [Daldinia caldariorum]